MGAEQKECQSEKNTKHGRPWGEDKCGSPRPPSAYSLPGEADNQVSNNKGVAHVMVGILIGPIIRDPGVRELHPGHGKLRYLCANARDRDLAKFLERL